MEAVSDVLLIDTDVLIDAGHGIPEAVTVLEQAAARGDLAISVVTEMELIVGCRNRRELEVLTRFLARFAILYLDRTASEQAAQLLRQYRLSHNLLIADALIAATAISRNISLISKNQRDYRFINTLNLLSYPDPFPDEGT